MDTAKLKGFLHELTSNLESVELDDAELSLEFPSPEELIQDGADPQFALYSTVQTQLLSIAVMLEKSGIVEDYHAAVESGLETYMPGFPPMSPVTDSYFYLWALLDLKFGTDRDNIGRVAVEVLKEAGAPAQLFDIYDNLLSSRMGIYETIGDDGDLLVVRELVTGRELLVDAPTGYLGSDGELRFVRLAPPSSAQVEYFTELTTPYILTGRSADDWTAYLLKMMPPRVDAGDGVASTNMDDRLAAVFKDDRGVMPWLEFVFQSFHSFEDDVIYLSGIPDDPESLAHGNHTTATNSTMNPDSGGQAASQGVLRLPHASGTSDEIKVALTEAQRQVAAELMPGRAGVFKPESKGKKPIRLPAGDWKQLRTLADTRLSRETGRGRTRVKNLRTAIDSAFLPDDTTPLGKTDASTETVYRMRIDLNGVTPPIWRRVEVLDCSLAELHCVVQAAMGWDDSHLHEFTIDGQRYSIPNPYGHPDDFDAQDSTDTRLSHLMRRPGKKFTYMYDFGDSWDHTIKVEAIEPADPRATYPRCVTGKRNCPPEDCGGIWGYEELVEILSDPNHPEYEERIDWCGELDSESFSAASCTRLMRSWWAEVAQPEQAALPQQMSDFDINEDFFTDDELDEDAFQDYSTHLQAEFLDSPEFDSLPEGEYGFVDCLLHYGVDYLEVTPATMTVADLHEVLFEITPRKVMLGPEEAEITILELNAFFQFIHREYSVPGAGRLVTALDNSAVQRLTEKLSDQSNFGMAKSFFKMGHAAGFDMTSEDGLQQFAAAYNSSLPVQDDDDAATTPSLSESDALTTIRRDTPRIGRNAPCPCGSGRKYKKCCLGKDGS